MSMAAALLMSVSVNVLYIFQSQIDRHVRAKINETSTQLRRYIDKLTPHIEFDVTLSLWGIPKYYFLLVLVFVEHLKIEIYRAHINNYSYSLLIWCYVAYYQTNVEQNVRSISICQAAIQDCFPLQFRRNIKYKENLPRFSFIFRKYLGFFVATIFDVLICSANSSEHYGTNVT